MTDTDLLEPLDSFPDIQDQSDDTPPSTERLPRIARRMIIGPTVASLMITPLLGFSDPFAAVHDMTGLIGDERIVSTSDSSISPHGEQETEADSHNRTRLALLARQYVERQLKLEDKARLAIATERVRQLIPRVTVEDFEALTDILEDVAKIQAADTERRRRLGID